MSGAGEAYSKEEFINRYKLKEEFGSAERIDSNLWKTLQSIGEVYTERSNNNKAIADSFLLDIIQNDDLKKIIHSARCRIKDVESLKVKIVKKLARLSIYKCNDYEKEKYRYINENNYYKIVTDLIGIRIIIRYREEWGKVDKWIMDYFGQSNEPYIKNYIDDYKADTNKPFIIEKPKIFYRSDQDMTFYQNAIKGDYCLVKSKEGYNSVHYIINKDGKYIEIQVRTIYDEAWSECTHDIVYKSALKGVEKNKELGYISKCLAQQTIAAENMVNYMYEMVNGSNIIYSSVDETNNLFGLEDAGTISEKTNIMKMNIGQRIEKLRQESEEKFSGNIDDLI